ncbi:MAG: hypothetical protein O7A69_11645, partial [SAR324 cluster bacterium]|nr:hypothetical protein [SAR324 cluster bacterium]
MKIASKKYYFDGVFQTSSRHRAAAAREWYFGACSPGDAKKPGVNSVICENIRGFQTCTLIRSIAAVENCPYRNCRGLEEFQIELMAE